MSALTSIQWTDRTWNPVRGCSRVSAGCDNCYAMNMAHRFSGAGKPFEGLTTIRRGKVDWTGVARFIPGQLAAPMKWRKPARIFVNSMSDLFHPSLSNEEIAAVFGVMAACPQHTFQVLTKQPKRAAEWFKWVDGSGAGIESLPIDRCASLADDALLNLLPRPARAMAFAPGRGSQRWPIPNVHLGTSAENQETYNARVPTLVHGCPAAVHFVSIEPMLGPMRLRGTGHLHLDWVIIGGESGPGSRPCDVAWIESIVDECRENAIPCFVKQLGGNCFAPWRVEWRDNVRSQGSLEAVAVDCMGKKTELATVWKNGVWHTWDRRGTGGENASEPTVELAKAAVLESLQRQHVTPIKGWARHAHMLRDKKGGDPSEWPESLRVRQFPEARV